jgi:hypothetical protein
MRRRDFMWIFGSGFVTCVVGCKTEPHVPATDAAAAAGNDDAPHATADGGIDACVQNVVTMHDTYAQALYFDGTNGPLTGTVTVAHVIAAATITMDFWHGHGGQLHRFTLEPSHFAALKRGERITVGTTMVDGHAHTLFIDPRDEEYRVPNAPDVEVPLGC